MDRLPLHLRRPGTLVTILLLIFTAATAAPAPTELTRGFSASVDTRSSSLFQPLLYDPTGVFSLGFLRLNGSSPAAQLLVDLAVVHLPSLLPLWSALPASPAAWSSLTSVSFDGHLSLVDRSTGSNLWSTNAVVQYSGDIVVLSNTSNLQITAGSSSVLWQSFDFPTNTIVQGQNFTSNNSLLAANTGGGGPTSFSMRIGFDFIGLYMDFPGVAPPVMYWKHTALQAKAEIVDGGDAPYARVEPAGYLAMYQREGPPADVLPFDTFNRGVVAFRRLTLERDGNVRAYYWSSNASAWQLEFTAIAEPCDLPTACGAYGICDPDFGSPRCAPLANSTASGAGDLCGAEERFEEVRRSGVDLANKELLGFMKAKTAAECEQMCASNCSCWAAVYSNSTGYCYVVDYPLQTVVAADVRKVGYFKVRAPLEGKKMSFGIAATVALTAVGVVAAAVAAAFCVCWALVRRRRGRKPLAGSSGGGGGGVADVTLAAGPYKGLRSESFGSVEMSAESFRK